MKLTPFVVIGLFILPAVAVADDARQAILDGLAVQARAEPGFTGFSADRGRSLFVTEFKSGKVDTPSCTSCHGTNPALGGRTRAGKDIDPMAVSKTPQRYTDPEKVGKWFERNCDNVLARPCTAKEKGDFITFMMGQ